VDLPPRSTRRGLCLPFLLVAAAACTGIIHGDIDIGAADGPRFARLTHAQWENTIQDLFGLPAPSGLSDQFQPDPPLGRFDNNIDRLLVTGGHWQHYQRAAELIAERVTGDPALLAALLPTDLPAEPDAAARAFVAHFGARAFRRPLATGEVERYAALFAAGPEHYRELAPSTAGVRLVVESMLQSPFFLYRAETAAAPVAGAIKLDGYEVASRLSYAFWNTMPDAELFAAAAGGDLDDDAGVRAHAERLFDHPRTQAQFAHFHFQAFSLREYTDVDKDPELFPQWSEALAAAMQEETTRFLDSVVFGDHGIRELLTSTTAFVNADLAELYGIAGDFGAELREVRLDPAQRAGFLTRVGFLTRNATLTETDPIHRGVFVNLDLVCRELAALPELPDNLMPVGNTNRERITSITGEGTCGAGCHSRIINPPGFALEHYDALGRYRTEDNGFPIDAADVYLFPDGREIHFQNAIELSQHLAEAPEVHACYTRQLLEYLYGRSLGEEDHTLVEQLAAQSLAQDLSVRELVLRVVTSRAFRFRPAR
jgi:hypothetical protein